MEALVEEDPEDANTIYGVYSMINIKNKKVGILSDLDLVVFEFVR